MLQEFDSVIQLRLYVQHWPQVRWFDARKILEYKIDALTIQPPQIAAPLNFQIPIRSLLADH
ncbi:MAG: hypothetical protein Q8L65_10265 [Burkholderiales bacterium]|nr:hypothetical protein [Burkholderiales bacterium]MDP2398093.1 hypothetical protein [Burkholderiales bacterium]